MCRHAEALTEGEEHHSPDLFNYEVLSPTPSETTHGIQDCGTKIRGGPLAAQAFKVQESHGARNGCRATSQVTCVVPMCVGCRSPSSPFVLAALRFVWPFT